jgi:hypothetical protein
MNSREKVAAFAEQQLAAVGGDVFGRSLAALAPIGLAKLPADPAGLDACLYEGAAAALMLRSDDAEPLAIVRVRELQAAGVELVPVDGAGERVDGEPAEAEVVDAEPADAPIA